MVCQLELLEELHIGADGLPVSSYRYAGDASCRLGFNDAPPLGQLARLRTLSLRGHPQLTVLPQAFTGLQRQVPLRLPLFMHGSAKLGAAHR